MLGMAARLGLVLMLIFFRPLHSPDFLPDSDVLAFETWPSEELLSRFCGLYLRPEQDCVEPKHTASLNPFSLPHILPAYIPTPASLLQSRTLQRYGAMSKQAANVSRAAARRQSCRTSCSLELAAAGVASPEGGHEQLCQPGAAAGQV